MPDNDNRSAPSGATPTTDGASDYLDRDDHAPWCHCGRGRLQYPTRYWRDTLRRRRCEYCGFMTTEGPRS